MTFTQPEQRVRTGARLVPMKAVAIIAALGIALVVTMGPAPASAQTTVVRECGGQYTVARYNSDGSAIGVWNKQLSDEGTIYTAGKTWLLVEGDNGQPDRFVSASGVLQVVACDAALGAGVRQVQGTQTSTTLVSNTGQATGNDLAVSADVAQPFTTGSEAGGYRLTGVQLLLGLTAGTAPGFSVSIHEDSSSGLPGSSLGALTMVGSLQNTASLVQFTASGNGISVDASTTYWVVLDTHLQTANANFVTKVTASYSEDTAAAGWSIGNLRRWRDLSANQWPAGNTNQSTVHPIIIEGYAKKDTMLPANFDCNAHLGWEHTNGRQWDSADRVWRQVGSYFFTGQYADTGEPICELRFSSVGPGSYAEKLGYGYTLCSLAPTWQTPHPVTGEIPGGPARKHETGHLTSSGQKICLDADGLQSRRDYLTEQHKKNNP